MFYNCTGAIYCYGMDYVIMFWDILPVGSLKITQREGDNSHSIEIVDKFSFPNF